MIINHNIASLNTYRQLSTNGTNTQKSLEKLSSGLRINKAGDDAAGLAISEKMRGQIRGLDQASRNAQDGISLIQTAEGALSETHSILQRMKELATQSANGTNTESDRSEIQKEINQLTSEINRIGNTTEFNTQKLLDGGGSQIALKATTTTTDGGKAGKISNLQNVVNSSTGKSTVKFDAGNGTILTIQANQIDNNLAGKTIKFTDGADGTAITVTASGDDITIAGDFNGGNAKTLTDLQNALNNAGIFSGAGGVTVSLTKSDGTVLAGGTKLDIAGTDVPGLVTNSANGGLGIAFSAAEDDATLGVYAFDVSQAFVKAGDAFKLKIATGATPASWSEITLNAADGTDVSTVSTATGAKAANFAIGTTDDRFTAQQQAESIAAALKTGAAWDIDGATKKITDVYDISVSGSKVIFTEKAATGTAVTNGTPTTTGAVAGVQTYTNATVVEAGGSFRIDGVEIAVVDGKGADDADKIAAGTAILYDAATTTAANQATALKDAVNRNSSLNTKYSATELTGTVTFTQRAGKESSVAVKVETLSKAGASYTTKLQIGANQGQSFQIDISDMRAQALEISGTTASAGAGGIAGASYTASQDVTNGTNNSTVEYALDVSSYDKATAAIKVLDNAIQSVSAQRSQLGAYQNRLEHTIANLGTSSENLTAAESRIRDVDMAKEMMEFTKNNILSQAAQAMLAQANQQPQGVLQLLR